MNARSNTTIRTLATMLVLGALALPLHSPRAADGPVCADIPLTTAQDGREMVLDRCYTHQFDYDGDTYTVSVFYTEDPTIQEEVNGTTQCEADELVDCEHALPVLDADGDGDNDYAVQVADQVELMLPYYEDRSLPVTGGTTDFYVLIAEETGNGWIFVPNGLQLDDEYVASSNELKVRANVYHEGQHMVQEKFNDTVGWQLWYTEGIARTAQDHTDPDYDALTGSNYLSQFSNVLVNSDGVRDDDILTIKYDATTWWTWFMEQYAAPGETEPGIGWQAIRDFYDEVDEETGHSLDALEDYLQSQGSSFEDDFIDYTLALYAYEYSPSDPRLAFVDAEVNSSTTGLDNYNVDVGNSPYSEQDVVVQPRSSRYFEHLPGTGCDFVALTFDNNASSQAFSVMTVDDSGTLQGRWTVRTSQWARTVNTAGIERVVGVITGLDGPVNDQMTVGRGCVDPDIEIKRPNTNVLAYAGAADNPRKFLVRVAVTGQDGSGVAGLTKNDFTVRLGPDVGVDIDADVINAMYVQDDYWLLVQAPHEVDGVQTGQLYDLTVELGASDGDTQPDAVLYVERQVDKFIVMDRSGSMANGGRLGAAQNAGVLMTYELDESDQGAFVEYSDDASVEESLAPMQPGQIFNMAAAIQSMTASGATSIGDGLVAAAGEEDAFGIEDNACVMVLLSDGYENTPEFWVDVQDQVTDNECFMEVVGLGPTANEALLQQIAASSPGGGYYDYAPVSGGVPIEKAALVAEQLSWENYLGRVFDMKTTRAAGRQRIMSGFGSGSVETYTFQVDPTTDGLVLSVSWQTPSINGFVEILDPDGLITLLSSAGNPDTARVWRQADPKPGQWTVLVGGLDQQVHVAVSGRTLLELQLLTGEPMDNAMQGVKVPIIANLAGVGAPIVGADVVATVTNPAGVGKAVTLYDDGAHADMHADDGVYGNWYTQTTGGETVVADPGAVVEGQEPVSRGSYLVQAVALWSGLRREAQASFLLREAEDLDGDGFPDWWELENGLDPSDPTDPLDDPDGDGLPNRCEWVEGTDPQNPDTDGGGQSDGSEVPNCLPGTLDPLDPRDDGVGPVKGLVAIPEADGSGRPIIRLALAGRPGEPLEWVDVYYRVAGDAKAPWLLLGRALPPAASWSQFVPNLGTLPTDVEFRVVPTFLSRQQGLVVGRVLHTGAVLMSPDPYPPSGNIEILEGEQSASTLVDLRIEASDTSHQHGRDDDQQSLPGGTPPALLKMRVSTDPTFTGVPWDVYQSKIQDFDLGSLQAGEFATVYLQLMDEMGNISDNIAGDTDATVQFVPSPIVANVGYIYFMQGGDIQTGAFNLLADGRFTNGAGDSGLWLFQATPAPRIVLLHDAGSACTAGLVGYFYSATGLSGVRWCRDGTGDVGVWYGSLSFPGAALDAGAEELRGLQEVFPSP